MQPVSVVVTELNEVGEIARLVASLLSQQPPPAEVVVVDGGSTDGTWEWLKEAAGRDSRLVAIRDESCNLKGSDGPISRGRNVAIQAATSWIIACADAGCTYRTDWLRNLTAPIDEGESEYALGGSYLDPADPTVWDLASAPFFSVKLNPEESTKSCTARSMAFTRALWDGVGGFPEDVLLGEDTLFDLAARRRTRPAYVANAKALYRPQNSYRSACGQMARYAAADGMARVRMARLGRNAGRCLLELTALFGLQWTVVPLLVVLAIEGWYAFHRDGRQLMACGAKTVLARLVFSISVPWVVAFNHARGLVIQDKPTRWKNESRGTR
jgi:glycosyltransferase involved in cell wall biosynthesis